MQKTIDGLALFNARLDNNLSAFDLRERGNELRNFTPKFDQLQADEIARRNVNRGNFFAGSAFGTYGSDLANKNGGFDKLSDEQKRNIYQVSLLSQLSFTDNPLSTFGALNQKSLISKLASEQLTKNPDENLSVQARLDKQLKIIDDLKAKTPEEQAAADRSALSISANLRPDQLREDECSKLASISEREAVRRDNAERDAQNVRIEQAGYLKQIRDHQLKTGGAANAGEFKIRLENNSDFDADAETKPLKPSPTTKITETYYSEYQNG